ncbi:MAG: 5-carboxymethyl-2-hydroxymuconate Delta-isomerase [Betaproteobacteria bacterium]|nr:5-carboxymethyl-2-hydroxymuconate Delta-isomerase [Betaproteobacteria bacterium]
MPHLVFEYTANLEADGRLQELVNGAAAVLVAQQEDGKPVYPIGGVRVRAIRLDTWCMADGADDYAFVHGALKVGSGRGEAVLKRTGDALFDLMKAHFAELYERRLLALSLEIGEFSEAGTWKHNNVHAKFRKPV